MKFLLVGHAGCYNRGCEAILRTTIDMLNNEFDDPEIVVSSLDYENDLLMDFGKNVFFIPGASGNQWVRFRRDWFCRQFFRILGINKQKELCYSQLFSPLANAAAVISIGGDNYSLDYGFPEYFLDLNAVVKKRNKPLVIWGASVGPFLEDNNLEIIKQNLFSVDMITVRESRTLNYLKNALGVYENVRLVADPAFLLKSDPVDLVDIVPVAYQGNVLGFNISPILEKYTDKADNNRIVAEAAGFLNRMISKKGFFVLLIPHVTKMGRFNNDFDFMKNIMEKIENKAMAAQVSVKYNAQQMKYIISRCRFFIGARTHATIAALSSGIPTLCLGYSLKAQGINDDLFGGSQWLINVGDLSAQNLVQKTEALISKEKEVRELLTSKMPKIKDMAYKNVLYLKEVLA